MKIRTSLLGIGALALCLGACSSKEEVAPATGGAPSTAPEVEIPSQDEADASAADAINESNADEAMADLEKEINGDL
jgi:hypothetical protein